jgi:hypothetical protein
MQIGIDSFAASCRFGREQLHDGAADVLARLKSAAEGSNFSYRGSNPSSSIPLYRGKLLRDSCQMLRNDCRRAGTRFTVLSQMASVYAALRPHSQF